MTSGILDGRYEIIRKIGEGGFGITYEAVNIHNSLHVAIKECRSDKARFLREARVLRDFADEESIVTVLDSFEENDTAYIVMEYLDGVTLSEEIKKNGKWPAEKTVRALVPVMKALEKMHDTGVIHRDISPDNIMYMPDGSLILMDFGAALTVDNSEFTRTAVFKAVYSPPEQRDGSMDTGSWSDVYALCAVIWFCTTGTEPEDSLSRLLFDELKKPSEAGADMLPQAESALMKGLALKSADRTQDVLTLRTELEKVYPDLSEEEKKELERRRKKRRNIIIACVCGAAVLAAAIIYSFRINILFNFIETETIALDGSDFTDEEYNNSSRIVKERLKALATDDRYLIYENGKELFFEMPVEDIPDFETIDFSYVIRSSFSRPMVITASYVSGEDPTETILGTFSQSEDIISFEMKEDEALVEFSETAAERMNGLLDEQGNTIMFSFDRDSNYQFHLAYYGLTLGDGKTVKVQNTASLLTISDNSIIFIGEYKVPPAVFRMHFTEEPSDKGFGVNTKWVVKWENPGDTMFPGRNQKNGDEIPGPTVSTRYTVSSNDISQEGYDPSMLSLQAVLKNRLDGLGIPYSVGMDRLKEDTYVVKVPNHPVWMEELEDLCKNLYSNLFLGSSLTNANNSHLNISTDKNEDGTFSFVVSADKYQLEQLTDIVSTAAKTGDGRLYLYYNYCPIASCDSGEALESLKEDNEIRFKKWLFADHPEMDETTQHFADWLIVSYAKEPQDACYMDSSDYEIRDENDNPVYFDDSDFLPESVMINETALETSEYVKDWIKKYEGSLELTYYPSSCRLRIYLPKVDMDDPEASLSDVRELIDDNASLFEDGHIRSIEVTGTTDDAETSEHEYINIEYRMSFEEGRMKLENIYSDSSAGEERAEEIKENYQNYLEKQPLVV